MSCLASRCKGGVGAGGAKAGWGRMPWEADAQDLGSILQAQGSWWHASMWLSP